MNKNTNLLTNIFSYLPVKDLTSISSTSKRFARCANKFNTYWREACNRYFCTDYEHYRYLSSNFSIFNIRDCQNIDKVESGNTSASENSSINWKTFFQIGYEARLEVVNFSIPENYKNLSTDIISCEKLIFETLKGKIIF